MARASNSILLVLGATSCTSPSRPASSAGSGFRAQAAPTIAAVRGALEQAAEARPAISCPRVFFRLRRQGRVRARADEGRSAGTVCSCPSARSISGELDTAAGKEQPRGARPRGNRAGRRLARGARRPPARGPVGSRLRPRAYHQLPAMAVQSRDPRRPPRGDPAPPGCRAP